MENLQPPRLAKLQAGVPIPKQSSPPGISKILDAISELLANEPLHANVRTAIFNDDDSNRDGLIESARYRLRQILAPIIDCHRDSNWVCCGLSAPQTSLGNL